MKISLRFKVLAGVGIACLMGVAVTVTMERISFRLGLLEYLNNQQQSRMESIAGFLGRYYEQQGGWAQLASESDSWERALAFYERRFEQDLRRSPVPPGQERTPPRSPLGMDMRMDRPTLDLALLNPQGSLIAGQATVLQRDDLMRVPVYAGNSQVPVGELVSPSTSQFSGRIEQQFNQRQTRRSLMLALMALVLVLPLALLAAHLLLRQVQQLGLGVHYLTAGRYDQHIHSTRNDELGQLANDINRLARTLDANRQSQRRWIADISHELRTPVAILSGEIDALVDGVRKPSKAELQSLSAEVERLQRLIEDLYQLSRSDTGDLNYSMESLDMVELVQECLERFTDRLASARLELETRLPSAPVVLEGDANRLQQLMGNLLENTCRYTDPDGKVRVTLTQAGDQIMLVLEDSAPGVPEEAMPKLTDRLFRVEQSRSREYGGAGLGLAIAANIVNAHNGFINISRSDLGGLRVEIQLPKKVKP